MAAPRKFCIVEIIQMRTRKGGETFYRAAVLEKGSKKVQDLYCRNIYKDVIRMLEKVKQGESFVGGPFDGSDALNCRKETVIMRNCAPVEVNQDVYKEYLCPAEVSFEDIRSSPKKRRVSVSGVVKQITCSSTSTGKNFTTVRLEDGASSSTISVNLWENVETAGVSIDDSIKITAVEVLTGTVVTSSPSSVVSSTGVIKKEGIIEAMSDRDDGYPIKIWMDNGEILQVTETFKEMIDQLQVLSEIKYETNIKREVVHFELL